MAHHSHIEMLIPQRRAAGKSQNSPVVQLESIQVRKHQPTAEEIENEKQMGASIKLEHLGFRK